MRSIMVALILSAATALPAAARDTVTGSARDHSSPNVSRLDGTIAATSALAFHVAFAMERPLDGTPSTLGGSWTIHLQGVGFGAPALDGTMTLAFDVPADGVAMTAPTTIERTGGGTGYTVPAGTCLVAASGRVHCDLPISPASGIGGLQLHGALDSAGASGRGTFAIGSPPISVIEGTWTAARMAESGAR